MLQSSDTNTSPGEKEDMELLERVLEKALRDTFRADNKVEISKEQTEQVVGQGYGSAKETWPGRSHFMERMRATVSFLFPFPEDWPCGSPNQTKVLVDRLTHQGHDLIHQYRTTELLAKLTPEVATEQGGKKNNCDSYTAHERLQMTSELQNFADQVKQEWEAWDRWRPEGGCLCPTGPTSVWEDGTIASLPLTVTYTTEAELQELEKLRMRVALLQQEINLEQALSDALSPHLSSIAPGPGCPNASVLRDMYSLLGEGGEHFPAIVQDSEPD
ncbi:hypothetical protein INR49_018138 [Caranx melampygus]|nr:hypothetical protein INR49_018138 [Caranx melampygus]